MTDDQRDEALAERREDVDLERRKSLKRFGGERRPGDDRAGQGAGGGRAS